MNELVLIRNNAATCDSLQVAEKFHKRHDNVIRSIEGLLKNEETQPMFKIGSYTEEQNNQTYPMYFMNRDGFSLLAMGFTGKEALHWKLEYIKAFNTMETMLLERQSPHWQQTRLESKSNRRMETDEIKAMVEYAKGNGSQSAGKYYMNFSKLANKAVGIVSESRDMITTSQLNNLILSPYSSKVCLGGTREITLPFLYLCYQEYLQRQALLLLLHRTFFLSA